MCSFEQAELGQFGRNGKWEILRGVSIAGIKTRIEELKQKMGIRKKGTVRGKGMTAPKRKRSTGP